MSFLAFIINRSCHERWLWIASYDYELDISISLRIGLAINKLCEAGQDTLPF